MRRLLILALLLVAAGAGVLCWWLLSAKDVVIRVPRSVIQEQLEKRFPIEKTYLLVIRFIFSNPQVDLENRSDKLRFLVDIEAHFSAAGAPHPGKALVTGTLTYDREQGEFYLLGAHLEHLTIVGVPDERLTRVQEGADLALGGYLDRKPIYRLKPSDYKQDLARMVLKQVRIEDGDLVLTLALGAP